MNIKKMRLADLNPAPYNPRRELKPGDAEFEKLKRSIQTFGYVEPIVINERTGNTVISGHQRLNVLRHLGETEADCVVVDMSLNDEKALNVAMNKVGGEWDTAALTELLKSLSDSGFDVTLTGFDDVEITDLFDEASEVVEDEPPEVNYDEPTMTHTGDIWELGDHRLMCGDATSVEDVENLVGGGTRADLLITDPPYNVDYQGGTDDKLKIANDHMESEAFGAFLVDAFHAANTAMKAGAAFYIWHSSAEIINFVRSTERELGKVRQILIWNKNAAVIGRQDYHYKHEPCLYGWTRGAGHYFTADRTKTTVFEETKNIKVSSLKKDELVKLVKELLRSDAPTDVIDEDKPTRSAEHPTMKPVKLIARQVRNSSKVGDVVLDVFGGSGSTLIACEQLGRRCLTMELDPHYCDVIIKRWETLTGGKAQLVR